MSNSYAYSIQQISRDESDKSFENFFCPRQFSNVNTEIKVKYKIFQKIVFI